MSKESKTKKRSTKSLPLPEEESTKKAPKANRRSINNTATTVASSAKKTPKAKRIDRAQKTPASKNVEEDEEEQGDEEVQESTAVAGNDGDDHTDNTSEAAANAGESSLTDSEASLLAQRRPELEACLTQLRQKVADINDQCKSILQRVKQDEFPTEKGVSFLELKLQCLLKYNMNLALIVMLKLDGKPLSGHPAVERLMYYRTVMERMRPIDAKLRSQIDKVVRAATETRPAAAKDRDEDPLAFKPQPHNMDARDAGDEGDAYMPPRIAAVPFEDDESALAKRERAEQRERKRLMKSSMLKDLRAEISDQPAELATNDIGIDREQTHKDKERRDYEEDNFVRLTLTKKDKQQNKRKQNRGMLSDITELTDLRDVMRPDKDAPRQFAKNESVRQKMNRVKRQGFSNK